MLPITSGPAPPAGVVAVADTSAPILMDEHRQFFNFDPDNNILFVTELSVRSRTSLDFKPQLYHIVDQYARFKGFNGIMKLGLTYETQVGDEVVQESVHLSFANATEITVPHTRLGLISYAIGAFLDRIDNLKLLTIHTCDHLKIRNAIKQWPDNKVRVPKFVIRNDCSNGFWNAASLSFLYEIQRKVWSRQPTCVVIAHTNSEHRFSAPEWAVASLQFLRDEQNNKCHSDLNLPQPRRRYLLHDFADDNSSLYLDAAYEVLLCAIVDGLTVEDPGTNPSPLSKLSLDHPRFQKAGDEVRLYKYSVMAPHRFHFNWVGRVAFREYLAGIRSAPHAARAQHQPLVSFANGSEYQIDFRLPSGLIFGVSSPLSVVQPNVEHELLSWHYANLLLGGGVAAGERRHLLFNERYRNRRDNYQPGSFDPMTDEIVQSEMTLATRIVARLKTAAPQRRALDIVNIRADCGPAPVCRMLMKEFTSVNHLKISVHSDSLAPELDSIIDLATIIDEMPRISELTIDFGRGNYDQTTDQIMAALQRAELLLMAAFGNPQNNGRGIRTLRLLNLQEMFVDACLTYIFKIQYPLSLINIEIQALVYPDMRAAFGSSSVMSRLLLSYVGEQSTMYKQLVTFLFSATVLEDPAPPAAAAAANAPEPVQPQAKQLHSICALLRNCRNLKRLWLDLTDVNPLVAGLMQNNILEYSLRSLNTLSITVDNDNFYVDEGGPRRPSFGATALRDGRLLSDFGYAVVNFNDGVDQLLTEVVARLTRDYERLSRRPASRQLYVAPIRQLEFSFENNGKYNGNLVSQILLLHRNLDNVEILLDMNFPDFDRSRTKEESSIQMSLLDGRVPLNRNANHRRTSIWEVLQREISEVVDNEEDAGDELIPLEVMTLDDPPAASASAPAAAAAAVSATPSSGETKQQQQQLEAPDTDPNENITRWKRYKTGSADTDTMLQNWFSWAHELKLAPRTVFNGSGTVSRRLLASLHDDRGPIHAAVSSRSDVFDADQEARVRWLWRIAPYLADPQFLRGNRAAVQLASTRMLYQSAFWVRDNLHANSTLQATVGCPAFGQFFSSGYMGARQGFETPGTRPDDAYIDFRFAAHEGNVMIGRTVELVTPASQGQPLLVMDNTVDLRYALVLQENDPASLHRVPRQTYEDAPEFVATFIAHVAHTHRQVAAGNGDAFGIAESTHAFLRIPHRRLRTNPGTVTDAVAESSKKRK